MKVNVGPKNPPENCTLQRSKNKQGSDWFWEYKKSVWKSIFAKLDFAASNGKIKRVILVFSCVPKPEIGLMKYPLYE